MASADNKELKDRVDKLERELNEVLPLLEKSTIQHKNLRGIGESSHEDIDFHLDNRHQGRKHLSATEYTDLTDAGATILHTHNTDILTEGSTNLFFTNERVDDRINALFVAGEGIDFTYDDNANTYTVSCEDATDVNKGIVELATNIETLTGTDTGRAVTPDDLEYARPQTGWIPAGETWTYASWDATYHTATFTISGDKTTKYCHGMRVKFTQPTDGVKHGIITIDSTYSAPNTTVTVFLGTDGAVGNLYDLDNEAITSPFYSVVSRPMGFPNDIRNWIIRVEDTGNRTQSTPTFGTWYNVNQLDIYMPVGVWDLHYTVPLLISDNGATSGEVMSASVTISTANNSESDPELTARQLIECAPNSDSDVQMITTLGRQKHVGITTGAHWYFNMMSGSPSATGITIYPNSSTTSVVEAVCAYF
jgi:hypothetical protein